MIRAKFAEFRPLFSPPKGRWKLATKFRWNAREFWCNETKSRENLCEIFASKKSENSFQRNLGRAKFCTVENSGEPKFSLTKFWQNEIIYIIYSKIYKISTNRCLSSWRCLESGTTISLVLRHMGSSPMTRWAVSFFCFRCSFKWTITKLKFEASITLFPSPGH